MIIDVTGVTSGSSPYLIYLCDWNLNSCFFITGVTSIPPIVQIDSNYYFPGLQLLKVKIFDNDGCFEIIDAPCLPTPTSLPPPPPTPTPGCAPCLDVCTYWQINLGAGPCIFKLFDCDGNVVNLRFFGTAGTYYVESVLQPQPFNQNCGYTIIDLGNVGCDLAELFETNPEYKVKLLDTPAGKIAKNLIVIVENVFQIPGAGENFTVIQQPTGPLGANETYLQFATAVPTTKYIYIFHKFDQ